MPITANDMKTARETWGAGLVSISKAYEEGGIDAARPAAKKMLDTLYGFSLGPVLFKPTLASGDQTFRPDAAGALAYYAGHDNRYPGDAGFGLRYWRSVESKTAAEFIQGDVAMWMGHAILTDKDGNLTTVDKSFGYKKDDNGKLWIILHHSSLPYAP